jgi:hypothetical protein
VANAAASAVGDRQPRGHDSQGSTFAQHSPSRWNYGNNKGSNDIVVVFFVVVFFRSANAAWTIFKQEGP